MVDLYIFPTTYEHEYRARRRRVVFKTALIWHSKISCRFGKFTYGILNFGEFVTNAPAVSSYDRLVDTLNVANCRAPVFFIPFANLASFVAEWMFLESATPRLQVCGNLDFCLLYTSPSPRDS